MPNAHDHLFERFRKECIVQNPNVLNLTLLELKKGYAKVEMELNDFFKQGFGAIWGGIIAGLSDVAAPYAVMTIIAENEIPPTIELKCKFLKMAVMEDGSLVCEAFVDENSHVDVINSKRIKLIIKTHGTIYAKRTGRVVALFETQHRIIPRSVAEKIAQTAAL